MSAETISGKSAKEWAMLILMSTLIMTIGIVGISFGLAVINDPSKLTITGSFDISQFTAIIIAIVGIAAMFVGQQLTARQVTGAIAQTDAVWQKG